MLYCRSCGRRHADSTVCPDCNAPLVPDDSDDAGHDAGELIAVLRTSDATLLPVVKSVLDAAGIPYVVQGDEAMGLLPLGPFGGGVFTRVLGASVLVPRDRSEEARELLCFDSRPDLAD